MSLNTLSAGAVHRTGTPLLEQGEWGGLWRVRRGVVRLDRRQGSTQQLVQLAVAQDLIGIETLFGQPYTLSASAFTDCELEAVSVPDEFTRANLMREALMQQQRRSQDMASVRTGTVGQRTAHLLSLLGVSCPVLEARSLEARQRLAAQRNQLPPLRELAHAVDAKVETVCRALGALMPRRRWQESAA
jgi:CRP-like cAMP-binding protein